ncbi:uncharacterized protein LOC100678468 [Nasonia vitripennis]|uniref:BTB domain-containing protein n=1 Tax=Nasonia vitripennis TaxID=7425 RepID=A0A7M7GC24_NASVI|nr:uncharacterized protein LOC100678468 [Nasonia vitripennis]
MNPPKTEGKENVPCCQRGDGQTFPTSVVLSSFSVTDNYKEIDDIRISNKKITLLQEPNESLSLSCQIHHDGFVKTGSLYVFNLQLSFDNALHHIPQSYCYDISLMAMVSKRGIVFHVPLSTDRLIRKENKISSYVNFFLNTDDIDSSRDYHMCCSINRINLATSSADPELTLGEALLQQQHCVLPNVRFQVDNYELNAHRSVLAQYSSVFYDMFSRKDSAESRTGVVEIHDFEAPEMRAMLHYLYTGRTNGFISEFPVKLMKVAHEYKITGLIAKCQEAMMFRMRQDNVVEFLELAKLCELEELKRNAMAFIAKHEEEMLRDPSYLVFLQRDLSVDTLAHTLKAIAKHGELSSIKDKTFEFAKENRAELAENEDYLGLFESHPRFMKEMFVYMNRKRANK